MVKKDVDPKLEPILDKIEGFDPERADRLRDNYGKEPEECPVHEKVPMPNGILSGAGRSVVTETTTSSDGLVISKHTVPVKRVPKAKSPEVTKQRKGQQNYRVCAQCGKKGAYSVEVSRTDYERGKYNRYPNVEYCKYCHPRKAWKGVDISIDATLGTLIKPAKKSWLDRLLRR
jgi:hypothetical protein